MKQMVNLTPTNLTVKVSHLAMPLLQIMYLAIYLPPIACVEGELRPIRLSESDFIVEVCRNRSFHQVCMDSWDHREASVVCRQLNINNGMLFMASEL